MTDTMAASEYAYRIVGDYGRVGSRHELSKIARDGRTDGRMDRRTEGRTDRGMDGRTDGWKEGQTDGRTDVFLLGVS